MSWRNYIGFCFDGALSMLWSMKGFTSRLVKKENPNIVSTQWSKDEINYILTDATEVISFMKQRPVTWKCFKNCKNLGKEHTNFLWMQKSGGSAEKSSQYGVWTKIYNVGLLIL